MTYDNLINLLFEKFPNLKQDYINEGEYIEGLPHLCYPIVFVPYIKEIITNNDLDNLLKICEFLEEMSICTEERVREVLIASILESILSERRLVERLKSYLKERTAEFLMLLEKTYGWV